MSSCKTGNCGPDTASATTKPRPKRDLRISFDLGAGEAFGVSPESLEAAAGDISREIGLAEAFKNHESKGWSELDDIFESRIGAVRSIGDAERDKLKRNGCWTPQLEAYEQDFQRRTRERNMSLAETFVKHGEGDRRIDGVPAKQWVGHDGPSNKPRGFLAWFFGG